MRELKEVELAEVAGGGSENYEPNPPSSMDVFYSETDVDFGPGFSSDLLHFMS
jgi:hypothetical protein